jgi:hypothetical protein
MDLGIAFAALENPVIVFDESLEDSDVIDTPIELRHRQPSFTFLGISPTPKGFNSLSDFRERRVPLSGARSLCDAPRQSFLDAVFRGWPQPPP